MGKENWESELSARIGAEFAEMRKGNFEADYIISFISSLRERDKKELLEKMPKERTEESDKLKGKYFAGGSYPSTPAQWAEEYFNIGIRQAKSIIEKHYES